MNKCTWSLKPFVCCRIVLVGFCQTFTCCRLCAKQFLRNSHEKACGETGNDLFTVNVFAFKTKQISHFTVMYLVAKPLIWSEAESDLVVIETSI